MQRMTRQRCVILETLKGMKMHPTANELYAEVRQILPKISLGTVYRNLDELTHCGLVRKLDVPGAPARFDGDTAAHWHVRCLHCGRLEDVSVKPARVRPQAVSSETGYQVLGYRLEFEGVCPECQQEKANNGAPGGKRGKPDRTRPYRREKAHDEKEIAGSVQ